ncbi:MAG: Ribosomal RNA small subunit methyltransferase I [Syntrophaceae bacterium PtaB.Bin038]|nr:MAG: Ribosomal RNA small subunit methyltransferase I [Syntrophaceae bacterium PtaB.Bin038]
MSDRQAKKGTLYLVSTPIGNLEDITLRAIRILKEVALIACEDTRRTRVLLAHYGIETAVTSLYDEIERKKGGVLVGKLAEGLSIAYVSDAGTPLISDPGYSLVRLAIEARVPVVPVPGPSAVIAALTVAGLPTDRFAFFGFLPGTSSRRQSFLRGLRDLPATLVFYESPRRAVESLRDIRDVLGDRQVAVTRELTKVFEEIKRGPVSGVLAEMEGADIRGEITLLVQGAGEKAPAGDEEIEQWVRRLEEREDLSTKDLASRIAAELDLPRKRVYDLVVRLRASRREGE